MKIVRIQQEEFDVGAALAPLSQLGGGGIASFVGIARADGNGADMVTEIDLEHYPAMTRAALEALVDDAFSRWGLLGGIIIHRVGRIKVGQGIVIVGTAAPHRKAALESCAFLIDRLKTDAPFWKKEYRADGSALWVEAKDSDNKMAEKWNPPAG